MAKKKVVAPVKAKVKVAPPAPVDNGLPVVYPELGITEYSTTSKTGPLGVDDIVQVLGWETEPEYQKRMLAEHPSSKPENWAYGDDFHCLNVAGEKVRCNNNAHNRPFDADWCEDLIHTVLYGQWAGPHTVPGETVNGETVRISRYGRTLSGQHQLTAAKLADEYLQKARAKDAAMADEKYPAWIGHQHVFIETIVVTGLSEDPRILMTIDYVKPRSAADVFYTSDVFKGAKPAERKELCRVLAQATDTLWERTDTKGYKTHPELVGFLERHKTLLNCVEHIYSINSAATGRKLSKLRLSAGTCAALMYLMGSSDTSEATSDEYRNSSPPSEKLLNWDNWDKAEEFWTLLANGTDFGVVRTALAHLVDSAPDSDDNKGMGGRQGEKLAILAKAWEVWKDHPTSAGAPFDESDLAQDGRLCLYYSDLDDEGNRLPDGRIKLLDDNDFLGIDCPESLSKGGKATRTAAPAPPAPTVEEIERAKEEARERRERMRDKLLAGRK